MPTSPTVPPVSPSTVWLARGRHTGPAPEAEDAVRAHLRGLKDREVIQDWLELPQTETAEGRRIFEARWLVPEAVTVRSRLTLTAVPESGPESGPEWVVAAEAERPWNPEWPSPATVFWPDEPGTAWDHDTATGLRLRDLNPLPSDDKAMRRVLRKAISGGWTLHLVVHEAMTPDERGRRPLTPLLPPGLRHRVVEHRAAPHQLRSVNWALQDSGVRVPRGGAVVLPTTPATPDYDADAWSVRTVFLDGSQPADLIETVIRFAALPRPLPEGADDAIAALRDDWRLLTVEEELVRARELVAMYAEALEAMTKSRDLYREAAERAHEALAAYRESGAVPDTTSHASQPRGGGPLQQLTRTLERLRDTAKARRPEAGDGTAPRSESDTAPQESGATRPAEEPAPEQP